jgi:hypothetical protein
MNHCLHYDFPKSDEEDFVSKIDPPIFRRILQQIETDSNISTSTDEIVDYVKKNVKCDHCYMNIMTRLKAIEIARFDSNTPKPVVNTEVLTCQQMFAECQLKLGELKHLPQHNFETFRTVMPETLYDMIKYIIKLHSLVYEHVRNTMFLDLVDPLFHVFTNLQICLKGLLVQLNEYLQNTNAKIHRILQEHFGQDHYVSVDSCPMITSVSFHEPWNYWKKQWSDHPQLIEKLQATIDDLNTKRMKAMRNHRENALSLVRKSKFLKTSVLFFTEDIVTVLRRFNDRNIIQLTFELVVGPLGVVQSVINNPDIIPLIKIGVELDTMTTRCKNGFHEHMTAWIHLRNFFTKMSTRLENLIPYEKNLFSEIQEVVTRFNQDWKHI